MAKKKPIPKITLKNLAEPGQSMTEDDFEVRVY